MTLKTANNETRKVTITLPKLVLERMNELVPARQRSRFVSEALTERLGIFSNFRGEGLQSQGGTA